jgi:hypothetical protein
MSPLMKTSLHDFYTLTTVVPGSLHNTTGQNATMREAEMRLPSKAMPRVL